MAEPERPHDEAWWERELNRNEKLMDKYMAAFGEDPDKFKNPSDLYNKVHFGIDPPENADDEEDEEEADAAELAEAARELEQLEENPEFATDEAALDAAANSVVDDFDGFDDDNDPPDNEDYPGVAKRALKFAVAVMRVEGIPEEHEVLYLSAGKVGANLAGGHGLGYDDDLICGNIVKCKWALADCEFCREILAHLYERSGDMRFEELRREAQDISALIRERIARLRKRVWW